MPIIRVGVVGAGYVWEAPPRGAGADRGRADRGDLRRRSRTRQGKGSPARHHRLHRCQPNGPGRTARRGTCHDPRPHARRRRPGTARTRCRRACREAVRQRFRCRSRAHPTGCPARPEAAAVSHNMSFDARFARAKSVPSSIRQAGAHRPRRRALYPAVRSAPCRRPALWLVVQGPGKSADRTGAALGRDAARIGGFPRRAGDSEHGDPIELGNGVVFPRRWDAIGLSGRVGIRLCWGFGDGYPEFRVHVRGASGAATADLQLGSFSVERQGRQMLDIDAFGTAAASATRQVMSAAQTAASFALGKIARTSGRGAFADSITAALRAFHAAGDAESLDDRLTPRAGQEAIKLLQRVVQAAQLPPASQVPASAGPASTGSRHATATRPDVLVTGGSGLIGREVVRHLVRAGTSVRTLARRGRDRSRRRPRHPGR